MRTRSASGKSTADKGAAKRTASGGSGSTTAAARGSASSSAPLVPGSSGNHQSLSRQPTALPRQRPSRGEDPFGPLQPAVQGGPLPPPPRWTLPPPPSASSPVAAPSSPSPAAAPAGPTAPVDPCIPPGQAYFARPRRKISLFPHVDDEPVGPAVPMRPRWDLLPPPPPPRPPPQPRALRGFFPGPYDTAPGMLLGSFGASGSSVSLASGRAPPPQPRRVWMGRGAPPPPNAPPPLRPSGDAQSRSSSGWGSWGSRSSGGGVTNSLLAPADKKDEKKKGKKKGKKKEEKKEEKGGDGGQ